MKRQDHQPKMFNTILASPADAVTTRRLQIARRSAQRKTKPTQGSRIKSRRSEKLSNQGQGDERNRANFMPTAFNQTVLSTVIAMQPATHIYRFMFDQGWTLVPLNRLWSFGFDGHQLMTLLQRVPSPIVGCIADMCTSWEDIIRARPLENLKACFGCWTDTDEKIATILQQNPFACRLTMTFDASTQMRTGFTSNCFMASILNMTQDALNRRLATYDLPLPFCDLDFVCLLLHQLLRGLPVPGVWRVSHLRLMPAGGGQRRCMLVSWCSFSEVNGEGEVVEVRLSARP